MTTPSPAQVAPAPLAQRQVLVVFSGLLLVLLLAALDSTIVATALPTIVGELGGLAHLAWVVTAYLLAQTIVTPLYGKLGDLYGRKPVLQTAIAIFLTGSVLCGMSRDMTMLILFRAIQGLGGGGLTVTTQAVVGDIVPPRERGRYQGIFGAIYGLASIAGPLLGGYFTTHLTWRWIFYVNVPLGIIAFVVLAATMPAQSRRVSHAIDYVGTGLLAVVLSAITLVSDVGGSAYAWTSPVSMGLIAVSVVGVVVFVLAERRAAEPVLPLRLFANRAFSVTSAIGLIVGFALFGSVTYLPLFLQVVERVSPTASGLEMLPMMGGMLVTSIASGQLISRSGRYKAFPIVGTIVMAIGLVLLSRMDPTTTTGAVLAKMLVLGLGLGLVMQVLVIAVQNAVEYRDLGVATSGAMLFRLIGGSIGTAVLGAIFATRLTANLLRLLPPGTPKSVMALGSGMDPSALGRLPAALRAAFAAAFTASLGTVFVVAAGVALLGFVLAWLLPEHPLRESVAAAAGESANETRGAFPMPIDTDSAAEILRSVVSVAGRDVRRQYIERIVERSGVQLTPLAAWVLTTVERRPECDPVAEARRERVPMERVLGAVAELRERGLITPRQPDGRGRRAPYVLTSDGCDTLARLVDARRTHLSELFRDWSPERHEELDALLRRLAADVVPDAPRRAS